MCARSKLEMEQMALRDIPPHARHGTRIVFRRARALCNTLLRSCGHSRPYTCYVRCVQAAGSKPPPRSSSPRQGSPLLPSDLALVSAHTARAVLIVADQSRSAAEADAQSLR